MPRIPQPCSTKVLVVPSWAPNRRVCTKVESPAPAWVSQVCVHVGSGKEGADAALPAGVGIAAGSVELISALCSAF